MATYRTIDEIDNQLTGLRTRRVWEYWRRQAGSAPAPSWNNIKLIDLYRDAPIMLVLDVLLRPDVADFRYRFVGTTIVQNRWKLDTPDHTGLTYFEVSHQYDFQEVKESYDRCVSAGHPILLQRSFETYDASGTHERLILPIQEPSGDVDKLIVVVERLKERKTSRPSDPILF
ncbi:MAG: hypothetical protein CMM77_06590 [Rhodospirillaceae bacterium]|nr:hypothetical protein [Magnetovibrio sp.]MAY66777.1 hypothetical protein [Rhodospirillaceae bacterium]